MAARTPREVVVEIDGLWFRFQKLRGRRSWRGDRALRVVLGPSAYAMISGAQYWTASEDRQLQSLDTAEHLKIQQADARASVDLSASGNIDEVEDAMLELLAYTQDAGGQGVSYRESPPDPSRPSAGWMPIRSLDALDTYDAVDHLTWRAIRWEMIKLTYRPTTAATGTAAGTRPEATTSTQASGPSGQAPPPPSGAPSPAGPILGMSGG
jgi:hypothetical protein